MSPIFSPLGARLWCAGLGWAGTGSVSPLTPPRRVEGGGGAGAGSQAKCLDIFLLSFCSETFRQAEGGSGAGAGRVTSGLGYRGEAGRGAAGGETKLIHCKSWPAFKLGNGVGRIFCSIHLSSPLAINNIHKYFRGITKMHILDFKCIQYI